MYKNSVKKIINFSAENLHLYHYSGNNPIKYVDPDGRSMAGVVPLPEMVIQMEQMSYQIQNSVPQLAIASCVVLGIVLLAKGVNYTQNKSLAKALGIIEAAAVAPVPLPPDDHDSKGTQTSSKTVYNKKGIHIDVENPGHRPGQIHVQKDNTKYLYDVTKKVFVDKGGELAPSSFQKLLEDPKVVKAIAKGLEILGY